MKLNNITNKFKKSFKSFMYEEKSIKKIEENKKEEKENGKIYSKNRNKDFIWWTIYFIVLCGIIVILNFINMSEESELPKGADFLEKKLDGDVSTIYSGELTKYMIDNLNGIYLKIAMTKIGDEVAYSLTYRYDLIPSGQVVTNSHFNAGSMASILLNGYPNKSYEDMGLNSDEEAYLATQLAVYEFVSNMQYEDISNGEFSIDNITASDKQYEDMVARIKLKAKELLNYALENPFEEDLSAKLDKDKSEIIINNNVAISGPYYVETDTDEITKSWMGDKFNPTVKVDVKSFIENTSAEVVDKDGNKLENVKNGDNFYIKINGTDKIFSQFKLCAKTNVVCAKIYESNENRKKYVVLEPQDRIYPDITSIIYNLDSSSIDINFKNYNGEILKGIKYYIYDENDKFIQDIDANDGIYDFDLPVGKYYIKIYEIPDGYFINGERFDFEVIKNKKNELNVQVDTLMN